jgi:hypothetical protein
VVILNNLPKVLDMTLHGVDTGNDPEYGTQTSEDHNVRTLATWQRAADKFSRVDLKPPPPRPMSEGQRLLRSQTISPPSLTVVLAEHCNHPANSRMVG